MPVISTTRVARSAKPSGSVVPRVALLVETSHEYGRGLLRGITRYHAEHGPWSMYIEPRALDSPPPAWLRHWRGDGILARIENRAMADAIVRCGVPTVDLRNNIRGLPFSIVGTDHKAVAELVAEHLLGRGLASFAFCGFAKGVNAGSDQRGQAFANFVTERGKDCRCFKPQSGRRRIDLTWEEEVEELTRWVGTLPKPVGVMTVNDHRGLQVLDACRRAGVSVPDDLALVGVENDEILCNLASPPLSSVALDVERIGYEAAQLLHRMMDGTHLPARDVRLPPLSLVTRHSSDMLAIQDREVARTVQWIRAHACEEISVNQVVKHTTLSRRTLEQRFLKVLGRTLHEEIVRVKLERVQRLLVESELTLPQVAEAAGIGSSSYLSVLFHQKIGMTPLAFRRRHRRP